MTADATAPRLHELQTLPELFAWRIAQSPARAAYRQFDAASQQWQSLTWHQIGERVAHWRRALRAQELAAGARVGILVPNGLDHVCMDLATLALGLVPVPMHAVDNPDSIGFILQDSNAALLLVDSRQRWREITAVAGALPQLRRVIVLDAAASNDDGDRVVDLNSWLLASATASDDPMPPQSSVGADALAALVYTSGTTGRPKGVELTHRNVVSNIVAVLERFEVTERDLLLSFLPLSHTFERTLGYYLPIAAGACVAFARSVALLPEDLIGVRPTVLVSVPRIYERVLARVRETTAARGALAGKLLALTEATGWRRFQERQRHAPQTRGWLWALLRPLVADRVLGALGGRLRLAIAGGAPLSADTSRFFLAMGLDLLQGYGMTETSPVVSGNAPADNDPASVGRALPGVSVRIGEGDELQIAGPNVMRGYWNRPEDTRRALEPDGWLHTGDQARLVAGRIYIIGRIKDIIVTSTGEKVPPADLELAIQADPLFAQVLVVGEQRPFLAVLAVVDAPLWTRAAGAMGLDPTDPASLQSDAARQMALARIALQVKAFPFYAAPKQVFLTAEPWTIDAGLMTPTLKLKRPALERRFAAEIERMYQRR